MIQKGGRCDPEPGGITRQLDPDLTARSEQAPRRSTVRAIATVVGAVVIDEEGDRHTKLTTASPIDGLGRS